MEFKEILKDLRKSKGIKQSELSEVFNLERTSISQWETGKNRPNVDTLEKLADYFNVSVDYLLGRQEVKSSFDTYKRNERDIKLLNVFSKLNDLGKNEALKRVSELTEIPRYIKNVDHAMPIAAHNEEVIDEKELRLMQEDIDDL